MGADASFTGYNAAGTWT